MGAALGWIAVVVIAGVVAAGCSGGDDDTGEPGAVIATVEQEKILARDLDLLLDAWKAADEARQSTRQSTPQAEMPEKRQRHLAILHLIKVRYVEHRARMEGIDTKAKEYAEATSAEISGEEFAQTGWAPTEFEAAIRSSILSKALAEKVFPNVDVEEEDVRRYYDEKPELFGANWRATVDMAFFPTETSVPLPASDAFGEEARKAGATEVITDQAVQAASPLPPEILNVVPTMTAGTLSAPVKAGAGFWVIRARSVEKTAETFEAARASIEVHLADQRRQKLFPDWLDEQLRTADITVAKQFGTWPADWL